MTPEAIQALNELAHSLNEMNLPALVVAVILSIIVAIVVVGIFTVRYMNAVLARHSEALNNSNAQLTVALGLAGESSHNVALLNTSINGTQVKLKEYAEAFMAKTLAEVERTRKEILDQIKLAQTVLNGLPTRIDEGFTKATLASDELQLGMDEVRDGQRYLVEGMKKLLEYTASRGEMDEAFLSQVRDMASNMARLTESITQVMGHLEANDLNDNPPG